MNLQIEKLKQNILSLINNTSLPIGIIYYLFLSIEKDIQKEYYGTLNAQILKSSEEEEKKEVLFNQQYQQQNIKK